jgi:hypothetical protein
VRRLEESKRRYAGPARVSHHVAATMFVAVSFSGVYTN